MKRLLVVALCLLACRLCAADGVAVFQSGLQAFQSNGADALLSTWYSARENTEKITRLREQLNKLTQDLGPVVDTEVFAPHNLGRHVQKLYGVIYFEKRPLWLRAEYYAIGGRSGFIALEFSVIPEDILPLTWAKNPD
jgi:hypothetical protein